MDFLKKLTEKTSELTEKATKESQDFWRSVIKVPDNVQEERFNICKGCEFLSTKNNRCRKCGCFMNAKTWIPSSKCPVGKWDKYHSD